MVLLLRILLTGAFVWLLNDAATGAQANLDADILNAGRFALAIVVGFLASATWAPLLGTAVAGPMTGLMTDGAISRDNPRLVLWAQRYAMQGHRRLAVFFAFIEGVRRPELPAAFAIGMHHARPGSWLQYQFALEAWRFSNVANCLQAYHIIHEYKGKGPRLHPQAEINLALIANLRPPAEPAAVLAVPDPLPPPPLKRNANIRLFRTAEAPAPEEDGDSDGDAAKDRTNVQSPLPPE